MPKSATSVLPSRGEQDVLGLDVAVDDAVLVGVVERARGLGGDPERVVHRELALAAEPVAEALALDERHGEPEAAGGLAGVVDGQDVRVLEPGGEVDLALEALGAERGGELGEQDLEGDRAVVAEVVGQVDDGHAAAAELALERVAVGEGVAQAVRHAHGAPAVRETDCLVRGSGDGGQVNPDRAARQRARVGPASRTRAGRPIRPPPTAASRQSSGGYEWRG